MISLPSSFYGERCYDCLPVSMVKDAMESIYNLQGGAMWQLCHPKPQLLSFFPLLPSASLKHGLTVGHTCLMKETEWGRTICTRVGSNKHTIRVSGWADHAGYAGCDVRTMYILYRQLNIECTGIGLTHARPVTWFMQVSSVWWPLSFAEASYFVCNPLDSPFIIVAFLFMHFGISLLPDCPPH